MRTYLPGFTSFKLLSGISGAVGDSGKPILFYGAFVNASSGGTTTVSILNGATSGAPVAFKLTSQAANTTGDINLPCPVMLPNGCFVLIDANSQNVGVQYVQMA